MDTAPISISPTELAARLGTPAYPLVLDVRRDVRFDESAVMLPGAHRCAPPDVAAFAAEHAPADVVVYCVHGLEIGQQAQCDLAARGWNARFLEGGIEGWIEQGLPVLTRRADLGVAGGRPSRWVTRARPKIDRIACPWLVTRFIDPLARFFYVPTAQVFDEAKRREAVAYDLPGAPITHDGEHCSFDALLKAFQLHDAALDKLAAIVRGADTDRLDLTPQSAGLLALSQGLSKVHSEDDHAMLAAALPMYDALYAWCRA
jgi:rhodanese-related sulfurtransferase